MIIIGIISVVMYLVAILMISSNTYEFEKEKKIKFILIGILVILMITWLIVFISSNGIHIENKNYLKIAKTTAIFIFAPINTIFVLPYLGYIINKYKQKRLTKEKVKSKIVIMLIIVFIILVIETSYIKSFELGLLSSVIK